MSTAPEKPTVGVISLGDEALPMAIAIAEAGYPLHVWACSSLPCSILILPEQ
jgi:3-hydroxyisobutyrate dehydrogenase-like beta-hydroxyacid dehydrogenase